MSLKKVMKSMRKKRRLTDALALVPTAFERQQIDIGSGLQRAVQYVLGASVEGDLAEFGTASGFTASVIARTMVELEKRLARKLWLFDSFEGLPEATADADRSNPHVSAGVWGEGKCTGLTAEGLHRQISTILDPSHIRIEKGWFADTMKNVEDSARFALVHVDGDLYQSAIDCLSPMFERRLLSPGAIIVFDDWNCGRADNGMGERRAWREITEKHRAEFEDFGLYSWAGRGFILHAYH
jgi:O-methyltransferase